MFQLKNLYSNILFVFEREREEVYSFVHSLPQMPVMTKVDQAKAGSQDLGLGLPHGHSDPITWAMTCCFQGVCTGSKLESPSGQGLKPRHLCMSG